MRAEKSHKCVLLEGGDEYFSALEQAILSAKREIYLIVYIFEPDVIGTRIAKALQLAALRGVRVRLMVDAIGSANLSQGFIDQYFPAPMRFQFFRPIGITRFRPSLFPRLHAKLVVVDQKTLFIGGMNIIKDHLPEQKQNYKHDYVVVIGGQISKPARDYCRWLWRTHGKPLKNILRGQKQIFLDRLFRLNRSQDIDFLVRDNLLRRRDILNAYLHRIETAQEEVLIANPYFLPPNSLLKAFKDAAARGVRVQILLQGLSEVPILKAASRTLYVDLLKSGVRLYEKKSYLVHEKIGVIDRNWATIGSQNLDHLSIFFNLEANVVFKEHEICSELRQAALKEMEIGSEEMTLAKFAKRSVWNRLKDRLSLILIKVAYWAFTRPDLYN